MLEESKPPIIWFTRPAIKWYQMTITYDGSPVGYVGSGNTGLSQSEMLTNIRNGWQLLFHEYVSGEVVEASDFVLTTFDRDGVLGFVGGDTYQDFSMTHLPRRNMFGWCSNQGGENNYTFRGKW